MSYFIRNLATKFFYFMVHPLCWLESACEPICISACLKSKFSEYKKKRSQICAKPSNQTIHQPINQLINQIYALHCSFLFIKAVTSPLVLFSPINQMELKKKLFFFLLLNKINFLCYKKFFF